MGLMTAGQLPGQAFGYVREKGRKMSETIRRAPAAGAVRGLAAKAGVAAALAGAAFAYYGAYGDPHPKASQQAGVPSLVVGVVVVSAIVFGLLVPAGLRAIRDGRASAARWGLAHSIVALLLTPVAFWSGVPLAVGVAGALLGAGGRRQAQRDGTPPKAHTAALVISLVAVIGGLAMGVLGNTVMA
jgi:hypothetical protein